MRDRVPQILPCQWCDTIGRVSIIGIDPRLPVTRTDPMTCAMRQVLYYLGSLQALSSEGIVRHMGSAVESRGVSLDARRGASSLQKLHVSFMFKPRS